MTSKSILFAVVAGFLAVACSPGASEQTTINGTFETEAPQSVTIAVKDAGIDTTVTVADGKFSVVIPALLKSQATVQAGDMKAPFISDGTTLTMTFKSDDVEIVSNLPKLSLQTRYSEYLQAMQTLESETDARIKKIEDRNSPEFEALVDEYDSSLMDINLKAISENKDNFIGVAALGNIQHELDLNQLDSLAGTLDPSLDEVPAIVKLKTVIEAKKATSEGRMFTDFEIGDSKLSDYVGKGKYILVDFWASWCGPCKREIPNIRNVHSKYQGKDFDVLSVSVWDNPQATVDTAKVYGVCWNEIVGNQERNATTIYGIQGIPHIILFGPDGTIVKRDLRGEGIEEEVAKYVQPKK